MTVDIFFVTVIDCFCNPPLFGVSYFSGSLRYDKSFIGKYSMILHFLPYCRLKTGETRYLAIWLHRFLAMAVPDFQFFPVILDEFHYLNTWFKPQMIIVQILKLVNRIEMLSQFRLSLTCNGRNLKNSPLKSRHTHMRACRERFDDSRWSISMANRKQSACCCRRHWQVVPQLRIQPWCVLQPRLHQRQWYFIYRRICVLVCRTVRTIS